jgi:hypothetical protein
MDAQAESLVAQLRSDGRHDLADQLERELRAADEQYKRDLAEIRRTIRRQKRREQRHNRADERFLQRLRPPYVPVPRQPAPTTRPRRLDRRLGCGQPAHRRVSRSVARGDPDDPDPDHEQLGGPRHHRAGPPWQRCSDKVRSGRPLAAANPHPDSDQPTYGRYVPKLQRLPSGSRAV